MTVTPQFFNMSINLTLMRILLIYCTYLFFFSLLYPPPPPQYNISIIVALWSSYSLQSQEICSSICSPSPHLYPTMDTVVNLLYFNAGVACSHMVDMKAQRFILSCGTMETNHSCNTFQSSFLLSPFWF
jgi:hypothetical protein